MKRTLSILSTTALVALSTVAYANDAVVKSEFEATKNGGYEAVKDVERRAADGARERINAKTKLKVDADGNSVREYKEEAVKDGKGWFNKQKESVKGEVKKDVDGNYQRQVEKRSINPDGANVKTDTKTKVEVDRHGNAETTTEIKKTTDPKGLFNSRTETSKVKMRNGRVIEQTRD